MKKLLSFLMVLALAATGFAFAEEKTEKTTEATITEMMPVLDAVSKNWENYDEMNSEACWKMWAKVAENVKGANPTVTEAEMFHYAQATFEYLDEMPDAGYGNVTVLDDNKGFKVKSVEDKETTAAEHYAVSEDGALYVTVGVYDENSEKVDTVVLKLVENTEEEKAFSMRVAEVNPDMTDVTISEEADCSIKFTMPKAESKELKRGSQGEKVKELQKRLRKLGYLAMYADGDFGPRTEEAVKLFQQTAGLTVDGIAGYKTLKALNDKDAPKCPGYIALQKSDSGRRVKELQNALVTRGLLSEDKVTEKYDADTVAAVKTYLEQNGLTGDGTEITAETVQSIVEIKTDPETPETPVTPDPETPETPETPVTPETPETPVTSETETSGSGSAVAIPQPGNVDA